MKYRAIYAYAWDLIDEGISKAITEIRALGLNTITIAGSYHAGKFLRPHGRSGRVYFPEDGTIYFNPDPGRYGAIKPVLNRLVQEHDVLHDLTADRRIATHVWLVLLHNSRLGERHLESTVCNAFGDRYVYSLCPSAPEVREYVIALCKDVTDNYAVAGVTLETPGFLPYVHGFHHESALVRLNAWIENRLGLCFCDHCVKNVESSGVDARALRARIRDEIDTYLADDRDFPNDMANAFWIADVATDRELSRFLACRSDVVTSLVREIRSAVRQDATVAVIPSVARPTAGAWYEGSDLHALAQAAGTIEACFYEARPDRVRADALDTQRRLRGAGRLRGILRPSYPDCQNASDLTAAAKALRDANITDVAFYNYGHVRRRNLAWIGDAISALGD
jgi:hypothetical protein